jgi:asparagine synthase (glutamine-hydrolysing)
MGNWRMNYWLRSGHQSAMGVPMEVRAPFLDIDVVNLVFQLPPSYLIRDGWHKWILRKAMADALPPEITWRKRKMGFPFPIREWLTQSKSIYFSVVEGMECPHINMKDLHRRYDGLIRADPYFLWRAMSVSLWWKRSVLTEEF